MNEKISFLKLFFQSEKDPLPLFISENIADCFPALIFIYDVESRRIRYVNQKFTDFTGRHYDDLKESKETLQWLVHPDDFGHVETLLNSSALSGQSPYSYCHARLSDLCGHFHFHKIEGTSPT